MGGNGDAALGDPQYAAPEAWRGSPDRSSDLFSLAAIFFRLVAGRPPLPGDTPQEILLAAGKTERLQLAQVAPDLPRDHLLVMNLCGRGDKDVFTVADALGVKI